MKPKLLLLVVPFVVAGLLQGCFTYNKMGVGEHIPGKPPDCRGYVTPIALGSTSVVMGVISILLFTLSAPAASDECEEPGGIGCWSPRTETYVYGGLMGAMAVGIAIAALVHLNKTSECNNKRKAHEALMRRLTPRQLSALYRLSKAKKCNDLISNMRSFPSRRKWKQYISECKGTWKKYVGKHDKNDYRYLKMMILGEVSFNAKDAKGRTLLHYAASIGRANLTKFLLKKGADPKIKDNEGKTALDIAVEKGHEDVVELLRKAAGGTK